MRFDLLHEHDRFVPGWHTRPDLASMRAEFARPEWRWPTKLHEATQTAKARLLAIFRLALGACRGTRVLRSAAIRLPAGNPNPAGN